MVYKRTQIYLDPEEHRRLVLEAAERGISLTEYLRRIVADRVGENAPRYESSAWEGIFNIGNSGGRKDTVENMDEEVAQAIEAEYQRSLNRPISKTEGSSPRQPSE
jgi:hypothetical protein